MSFKTNLFKRRAYRSRAGQRNACQDAEQLQKRNRADNSILSSSFVAVAPRGNDSKQPRLGVQNLFWTIIKKQILKTQLFKS